MSVELVVRDLEVEIEDNAILKGIDLDVHEGEVHALMGPNGSGKSTLSYALMGHPQYQITKGDVLLNGESLIDMEVNERAKKGLFLSFQYPTAIPGVSVANFLRTAVTSVRNPDRTSQGKLIPMREFRKELLAKMEDLEIDPAFARRYLNDGFSGGEKKRMEILQMSMLEPKVAVLDEADTGLDIDALRIVAEGVNRLKESHPMGILLITHYQRLLNYIKPNHVHILLKGRIVESGGPELAHQLEARGYDWVREKHESATTDQEPTLEET